MDFKQQYKTEMQNISPTEEQCERIRAKVYEAIQDPRSERNKPRRKKPLPLKAIAITGASAACLVLVSALALQILPSKVKLSGGTCDAAPNGMYAMEANRINTADAVNEGSGDAAEPYGSASLDPTADGSAQSDPNVSLSSQVLPGAEKSGASESLASDPLVVKMLFSEDMSECEVYRGSEFKKYALSNEAPLTADNEGLLEELPAVNSNIENPLFIYTSGDKMWVYDENKQFIGCFIQIS